MTVESKLAELEAEFLKLKKQVTLRLFTTDPSSVSYSQNNSLVDGQSVITALVQLFNFVWSSNTPAAGSISWTTGLVTYLGNSYSITAGSTAEQYVYWDEGDVTFTASATYIPQAGRFLIATNVSGTVDSAWNKVAQKQVQRLHLGFDLRDKQEFTASGNFTVPDDVNFVYTWVLGAGGGGGGAYLLGGGGGGGGGAGQVVYGGPISVTPGATIAVAVGVGGTGGTGGGSSTDGGDGGSSSFGTQITAAGGLGGKRSSDPNGGAGALGVGTALNLASIGMLPSTTGAAGKTHDNGGAGGGGGSVGVGNTGTNRTGAVAHCALTAFGVANGADGGNWAAGSNGAANSGAGGGGGGNEDVNGSNGGNGGSGRVIIWW